jgi:hypothetical protein
LFRIRANWQTLSQALQLSERGRQSTKDPKGFRAQVRIALFQRGRLVGSLRAAPVAKAAGDIQYRQGWRRLSTKVLEHSKAKDRHGRGNPSPPPPVPKVLDRFGLSSGLRDPANRCGPLECAVESRATSWRSAFRLSYQRLSSRPRSCSMQ